MYWEMTLSRGILRGDKLSVEWMLLLIALHVLGDDTYSYIEGRQVKC